MPHSVKSIVKRRWCVLIWHVKKRQKKDNKSIGDFAIEIENVYCI